MLAFASVVVAGVDQIDGISGSVIISVNIYSSGSNSAVGGLS